MVDENNLLRVKNDHDLCVFVDDSYCKANSPISIGNEQLIDLPKKQFKINTDGSVSPAHDLDFVIGCVSDKLGIQLLPKPDIPVANDSVLRFIYATQSNHSFDHVWIQAGTHWPTGITHWELAKKHPKWGDSVNEELDPSTEY